MRIQDLHRMRQRISASGLTIYHEILPNHPDLWLSTEQIELLLADSIIGTTVAGLPVRTRSKVVKALVCEALGYPVPQSFARTQPRFFGQNLDIYVQKSNNLQVWNEEVAASRRYAVIGVDADDVISAVRVITGEELAHLDRTGTLTSKFQARWSRGPAIDVVSPVDTATIDDFVHASADLRQFLPADPPEAGQLLSISAIARRLAVLVGTTLNMDGAPGRQGGMALETAVLAALGYSMGRAVGMFPDVPNQLLEVKLQTAATIDLGLVEPNSLEPVADLFFAGRPVAPADVRYAVLHAVATPRGVVIDQLTICTGADFFSRFHQFGGHIRNTKLQIPLPNNFFDG